MVSSYWANFAATADPNGKDLPRWPPVSAGRAMTMELGEQPHAIPVAGSPAKQAFFERFLEGR